MYLEVTFVSKVTFKGWVYLRSQNRKIRKYYQQDKNEKIIYQNLLHVAEAAQCN